jgi:hypothetical protein
MSFSNISNIPRSKSFNSFLDVSSSVTFSNDTNNRSSVRGNSLLHQSFSTSAHEINLTRTLDLSDSLVTGLDSNRPIVNASNSTLNLLDRTFASGINVVSLSSLNLDDSSIDTQEETSSSERDSFNDPSISQLAVFDDPESRCFFSDMTLAELGLFNEAIANAVHCIDGAMSPSDKTDTEAVSPVGLPFGDNCSDIDDNGSVHSVDISFDHSFTY